MVEGKGLGKSSWIVSARVDVRVVADLARFFIDAGIAAPGTFTTSEMARMILTNVRDVKVPLDKRHQTAVDALSFMRGIGMTVKQADDGRNRALMRQLQGENMDFELSPGMDYTVLPQDEIGRVRAALEEAAHSIALDAQQGKVGGNGV